MGKQEVREIELELIGKNINLRVPVGTTKFMKRIIILLFMTLTKNKEKYLVATGGKRGLEM